MGRVYILVGTEWRRLPRRGRPRCDTEAGHPAWDAPLRWSQPTAADRAVDGGDSSRCFRPLRSNGPSVVAPYTRVDGWRGRSGAGSVNHTTFPESPRGRTPQLSLTAAISASPRPE